MRPLPLIVAAAIVVGLVLRWRTLPNLVRAAALVVVAGFVAYGVGLFDLPNVEHLLGDIGHRLGKWTYLLVGGLAFLETGAFIGFVAPGEVAVVAGGVVAGQGVISVVPLFLLVWACCMAGDNLSFWLGRKRGRGWLLHYGERLRITEERLQIVERFLDRRGAATIVVGRFVGFVRPLAPFIAGASEMSPLRFAAYDLVGAGAWSATFVALGYVFWNNFHTAATIASRGSLVIAAIVVVGAGVVIWRRRHNEASR